MTHDYGIRKAARGPVLSLLAAGVAVVLGALVLGGAWLAYAPQRLAEARWWMVAGPPCAPVSAPAFAARGVRTRQSFDYDGVTFDRAYGHASCAQIYDHGGRGIRKQTVCQFSGPTALVVHAGEGDAYFAPVAGQPVTITISIDHGRASCVLGAPEWRAPAG